MGWDILSAINCFIKQHIEGGSKVNMKLIRRKRDHYKFTVRNSSMKGRISSFIGFFSILAFVAISFVSSLSDGNGSLLFGGVGLLLFGIALFGLILGINSSKEKEIYYTGPVVGIVLNGLMTALYFVLYFVGLI